MPKLVRLNQVIFSITHAFMMLTTRQKILDFPITNVPNNNTEDFHVLNRGYDVLEHMICMTPGVESHPFFCVVRVTAPMSKIVARRVCPSVGRVLVLVRRYLAWHSWVVVFP